MKHNLGVLFFLLYTCQLSSTAQSAGDHLVSATAFDKVTRTNNFAGLQKLYGKKNVKDDIDPGPEGGDSIRVTIVYPGSAREFTVFWNEKQYHKKIAIVECYMPHSPYYTTDSLKIGSTLKKLLAVNGKRISFSGMGWDYGGSISSFGKGKLERSPMQFQLAGKDGVTDKLMGDIQLNTDMPLVKKNLDKLYISKITLVFPN